MSNTLALACALALAIDRPRAGFLRGALLPLAGPPMLMPTPETPAETVAAITRATGRVFNFRIVCTTCWSRCSHNHRSAEEARSCERRTALGNPAFGPYSWCRCAR